MEAFFYFGDNSIGDRVIHTCACLAEGFKAHGINSYSNFDNYQLGIGKEFLIKHDVNHPISEADIVIIHHFIYLKDPNADENLIKLNKGPRKFISIFLDDSDGVRTPGFNKGAQSCDFVLKSHYNRKYKYPENFHPWQFGISKRIANSTYPVPYDKRISQILINFRVKHQLRDHINMLIKPIMMKSMDWNTEVDHFSSENMDKKNKLLYEQSSGRHNPEYYKRLSYSMVCACYGGVFAIPVGNYNKYTAKIAREINNIFPIYKWDRVRQWDSWRLWESWVAASCVIHIDLEKYGCVLPVMPQNGKHYLGIDIHNVQKFERMLGSVDFEEVGFTGREFALQNYSPFKVSERLLAMIGI